MADPTIVRCEQGTQEWHDIRLGIPTSSNFDKILTAKRMELSGAGTRFRYRNELLADWIAGYPASEMQKSQFMEYGTENEPRARAHYAFLKGVEVEEVGFVIHANGRTGCSPDGLVGDGGGFEAKCPALHTHVGYLLDPTALVADYRLQLQGSLWITQRQWWDIESWNSVLPPVIVRVEPEPEVHEKLDEAIGQFCDDLDEKKRKLADYRETRPDGFMSPLPGERSTLLDQLERSLEVAHG